MDFPFDIPFARLLDLALRSCADGQCEVACDVRPEFCNSRGVAHGGFCMTLLDLAMSLACISAPANAAGARCSTVEMKTSFMRPARGALVAHASVLHTSARLAFCEAWLVDTDGIRVAHATSTFAYLKPDARPETPLSPPANLTKGP